MHVFQKRIAEFLISVYAAPMNFALKRMKPSRGLAFKSSFVKQLYTAEDYFMISSYPKHVHNLPVKGTEADFSNTAILLQGPVVAEDEFTLNTVKMYKQYYNGIKIIISTWVDTNVEIIENLRKAGAYVELNEYPLVNSLPGNLNYQLTNSLAGVRRAKAIGAKYVAKTRTDQRYYNPCAMPMLLGLHEREKIVMLGGVTNSFYERSFSISDFFAFGETEELELLYGCELETEELVMERNKAKKTKEFAQYLDWVKQAESDCRMTVPQEYDHSVIRYASPETVIAYNYFLQKTSRYEGETDKDAYTRFLRDFVILVDADSLGFYWLKYNWQVENPTYFQRTGKLDTAKWFELRRRR